MNFIYCSPINAILDVSYHSKYDNSVSYLKNIFRSFQRGFIYDPKHLGKLALRSSVKLTAVLQQNVYLLSILIAIVINKSFPATVLITLDNL